MSKITSFEYNTRSTQAIYLLNDFKKSLRNENELLDTTRLDTLKNSLNAALGNVKSSDFIAYKAKDSNAIQGSVTIEISQVLKKTLDSHQFEKFIDKAKAYLDSSSVEKDDKTFLISTIESIIQTIDGDTNNALELQTEFEKHGF